MARDFVFDLSPTQSAFVHTGAHIAILKGPMGEGKTYAGVAALIRHAERCGTNIRGALIRDTHQNIKISTAPDIQRELGAYVTFKDDSKKMIIHSTPKVEMDLFGIDDPTALSKLQGPQYAIIWLEEPAPIEDKSNAGLPRVVYDLSIARASRQKGTTLRVQITQNPADEDHWTEEVANEPRIVEEDPLTGLQIIKEVFNIAYGENKYLTDLSRLANKAAFKSDPGKYARYVEGRAAPVQLGEKVTPEYNPDRHFSKTELPVVNGAIGFRFYDAWHHPVCLIGQFISPGKLWFHEALAHPGEGMRELLTDYVIPILHTPKFRDKIHDWRDIGDPSMWTPDQSTTSMTTVRVIEDLLKTRVEKGPTRWKARIQPSKTALTRNAVDGGSKILISSTAYKLHRALNGGWHWKTDNSGRKIGNLPVKDSHSNFGDAWSYGVSIIFPYEYQEQKKKKKPRVDPMSRAMSYAPSKGIAQRKTVNPMLGHNM